MLKTLDIDPWRSWWKWTFKEGIRAEQAASKESLKLESSQQAHSHELRCLSHPGELHVFISKAEAP